MTSPKPRPSTGPRPIRLASPPPLLRGKARTAHRAVASFRARTYQTILFLLDIAERLSADFSSREDRFGLDWNTLSGQVLAHYKSDVSQTLAELQESVMSREGAQCLPKGLYRNLLDFLEEGAEFMKWARSAERAATAATPPEEEGVAASVRTTQACARFQKACLEIQQHICIYENERDPSEESFFT